MTRSFPKTLLLHTSPMLILAVAALFFAGCGIELPSGDDDTGLDISYEDSDFDTIMDIHEGPQDTDGDGKADYLDTDSDGDSIPDEVEAGDSDPQTFPVDSDSDGLPDFRDTDSDDNGVPDSLEYGLDPNSPLDQDGDGLADYRDSDNDGDSISDALEIGGGQPLDSDNDDVADYMDDDSDNDLISDKDEARLDGAGRPEDADEDGLPNYRDSDSDDDGFLDQEEAGDELLSTAPRDTDEDGSPDFVDLDSDGDALPDADEATYGCDPLLHDTDGDGYSDGGEVAGNADPTSAAFVPQGVYVVVPSRSAVSAVFDFEVAIGRADVVFVLDTTGSMQPVLTALADDFSRVVSEVTAVIPDSAFGVVTFKDYNAEGMGGGSDKPFKLNQQVTLDPASVDGVLRGIGDSGGGDFPESAMEALYQSATGLGYDQDCDGIYDSVTDVKPFIASPADVFGGTESGVYDESDSTTGQRGGVGIRQYSMPIFVWTTDTDFRDPDDGDPAPGACGNSAGRSDVIDSMKALGGKLIGINVSEDQALSDHMTLLANGTWSQADLNDDGELDPLVFETQSGTDVVDAVVDGISSLRLSGQFQSVELVVEEDDYGFVQNISPSQYEKVRPGESLEFSLNLFGAAPAEQDDQIFKLKLVVVGDGATGLDTTQILVVIPGAL